jgi:hypothetical protein
MSSLSSDVSVLVLNPSLYFLESSTVIAAAPVVLHQGFLLALMSTETHRFLF